MVFSVPKSGTHLVTKALAAIPGISHSGKHFTRTAYQQGPVAANGSDEQAWERWADAFFASIAPATFMTSHCEFDEVLGRVLEAWGVRTIVVERDPRDVVVSWVDYLLRYDPHPLHEYLLDLVEDERIASGIRGFGQDMSGTRSQPSIAALIERHFAWLAVPGAMVLRFEDLIGEQGGGDRNRHRQSLVRLFDLAGVPCTDEALERVSATLFGGTHTFNVGRVGRWPERFTCEHRALFKRIAGDGLIRMGYETGPDW